MNEPVAKNCLAISGGVGGAKLALGLSHCLSAEQLCVVANTGDDFTHLGFKICPDLDTVLYTLADLNNKELGWGQQDESWNFLSALESLGGENWFQLGDRDLATHCVRSQLLAAGASLSDATRHLCKAMGVEVNLCPMSDDKVATIVHCEVEDPQSGEKRIEPMAFQHYFVRDRCQPTVTGFSFEGLSSAKPSDDFVAALSSEDLGSIIICPSNPFVSVDPVLMLPGVLEAMKNSKVPVIAVSPIVGGQAIKGPAAKMMAELGMPASALAVAEHYAGKIDGFVIDEADANLKEDIEGLGIPTIVTKSVMVTLEDRIELAKTVLQFANKLAS